MVDDKKPKTEFDRGREQIEGVDLKQPRRRGKKNSAAGPHVKKGSTNFEATPGAGALPLTVPTDDIDSGTG
ncbi:hypothetical protein WBO78_28490 [Bosea sp. CCNWLW174]|jgi:hypothetical protein|uniref:hypothetical protein n=1 Tax=unclassified Bosea (in: a-proteobacteria) TaxID=2653178 RepID=UPI0030141E42